MQLILTEKPSVTRQVKDVLAPSAKYITISKATKTRPPIGYYEDKNFVICNSVGHIVSIKSPKDINSDFTWSLDKVPYPFPFPLPLEVTEKGIFKAIDTCIHKYSYDEIIIATDGDREGQNIWRKINLMLKPYKAKKITRMWLDEWTPEGIEEAYRNRFPNSEKDGLAEAARCREEADYIIGMDCTTALTCKYARGKGNIASIGRVMGPTMYIVYEREQEIKNFVPKPYTALSLITRSDDPENLTLKMKKEGYTKTEADAFIKKLPKDTVLQKTTKKVSRKCPELYDATTIAQDMNKRYGFSAKKTSDIIQKLYQDYALTTYPGTNSRKMSEGSAAIAYKALDNLTSYSDIVSEIKSHKWKPAKHVVTSEGLAHEAITPVYGTINTRKVQELSDDERKVYNAIVERFLQVFYPKAEFEEVTVQANVNDELFEAKGKTMLEAGWMKVAGIPKDTLLPSITDGHRYDIVECQRQEKMTTPPARYTEDTLLSAMKNAGRFVEDEQETSILREVEGLGTGRTRPAIIENIKHRGYFEVKKKQILPTQKCMDLFAVLPETTLSSPSLTAQFEEMIQDVEDGKMTHDEYMKRIDEDVLSIIDTIKKDDSGKVIGMGESIQKNEDIGVCPICGKPIRENSKAYGCTGYQDGCSFVIWKEIAGKKITANQAKALLEQGITSKIKGFKSKSGKSFDAYLKLEDGKVAFSFEAPSSNPPKAFGDCPSCGHPMLEDDNKFYCENCDTKLYKNALAKLGKKRITKAEAKKLLDGERIDVDLVSKVGKPYTAKAYYDHTTGWVKISFD